MIKYIWQLPQHLLALILLFFLRKKILAIDVYKNIKVYRIKATMGLSLGQYVFVGIPYKEKTVKHEYGHSIQSLYFGPLYLIIVGLPSIIMNILSRLMIMDPRKYYDRWPESWADKLGDVER